MSIEKRNLSCAPVIIDVAINGVRPRSMNSNIPQTPEEIAEEAIRCFDEGASIVHAHNRDYALTGREAADDYLKTWRAVLSQRPDVLWYPTLVTEPDRQRSGVEHVEILAAEIGLRIGCIDPGSVNFGSRLVEGIPTGFINGTSPERIRRQFATYQRLGLGAAIGIYEPGFLRTAMAYYRAGRITKGSSINLYFLGDYGLVASEPASTAGLPPYPQYLDTYLSLMQDCDLPWFVSVWGAGDVDSKPLIYRALELGGHIQVGLELHYHPTYKPTNVELLKQVQVMAAEIGRPIATSQQAAALLGL
ncbi:MAG: 3-keto-5-aminohexanoate cleavage protein [Spongiibacteraceae bacterium]